MNPWLIVLFLVALAGAYIDGDYNGHQNGVREQKVADQKQLDDTNDKLTKQKAQATADLLQSAKDNVLLAKQRDDKTHQLEVQDAKNRNATDALRAQYDGTGLRFRAAENTGCRNSGQSAPTGAANPASVDGTTVVQLPDALERRLRGIAFDADKLKDEYAKCYGYATQVK